MKAAVYEKFLERPEIREVADPRPAPGGVVIRVGACGICRSDWHGWRGDDPDIILPHVPGHELAGTVEETGRDVLNWRKGDRVTVPFVSGCGRCRECLAGNQHICDNQFQPGFTAWGAFAEYVAVDHADVNLVRLPETLEMTAAASLGCRFVTSFRAVVDQGRVRGGEWTAVWGAGGVGLSAVMIASALGARPVVVDINEERLGLARELGAEAVVNAGQEDAAAAVLEITGGGADLSIEAVGHPQLCFQSISSLKKRGRHVQVGLMEADARRTAVPIDLVIARELEIRGSHGMQAHRYPEMFELIQSGRLAPEKLVGRTVPLAEGAGILTRLDEYTGAGVTVIDEF